MDLLQKIKQDRMEARMDPKKGVAGRIRVSLLTTLVGEAETALKGKQAAKFDMLALVKKFSANLTDSLKIKYTEAGHTELCLLAEYIPVQLDEDEIQDILDTEYNGETLGGFMGYMNKVYKGHFDGRLASKVYRENY